MNENTPPHFTATQYGCLAILLAPVVLPLFAALILRAMEIAAVSYFALLSVINHA